MEIKNVDATCSTSKTGPVLDLPQSSNNLKDQEIIKEIDDQKNTCIISNTDEILIKGKKFSKLRYIFKIKKDINSEQCSGGESEADIENSIDLDIDGDETATCRYSSMI